MLSPAVQALRASRIPGALPDVMTEDALPIIRVFVDTSMRNAVYSITAKYPDISYVDFEVGRDGVVTIHPINQDGLELVHPDIDAVTAMVNRFASGEFTPEEIEEFYAGYRVLACGVIKPIKSAGPRMR